MAIVTARMGSRAPGTTSRSYSSFVAAPSAVPSRRIASGASRRSVGMRTSGVSSYVGVEDAKRFMKALQTAIGRAESELARRAKLKPRKKASARSDTKDEQQATPKGTLVKKGGASPAKTASAVARAAAKAEAAEQKAKRVAEQAIEKKRKLEQRALEATLKELGGRTKGRSQDDA